MKKLLYSECIFLMRLSRTGWDCDRGSSDSAGPDGTWTHVTGDLLTVDSPSETGWDHPGRDDPIELERKFYDKTTANRGKR